MNVRPSPLRWRLLSLLAVLLAATAVMLPATAHASRYRVDLILFTDNLSVGTEQPTPALLPSHRDGISIDNPSALAAHGVHVVSADQSNLDKEWAALRYSHDFHPVIQMSWIQTKASSGTPVLIQHGNPLLLAGLSVPPIVGRISLHVDRLLYVEAHFRYNFENANGDVVSYKLNETRRVRFNELHYLDSPKLGILVRVTKVQ